MIKIGDRRNNEFSLGYQRNLHSREGAKNNGIHTHAFRMHSVPGTLGDRRIEAVLIPRTRPLPNAALSLQPE